MSMFTDVISAYISLVTNDDGAVQLMQGEGEQPDDASEPQATPDMAVMLPYGYSAHPPNGSDVIAVQVEGRAEQTVIAVQHRAHRPKGLSIGAVVLHLLQGKVLVHLDPADDTLHLGAQSADDFIALASKVDALFGALCDATPVAQDGGAALQTAVKAVWTTLEETVASEVVRAV